MIPDQLAAEALAWPLHAAAALEAAGAHLAPAALHAGFEVRAAALGAGGAAREVARAVWGDAPTPLGDWLRGHAHRLLRPMGARAELCPQSDGEGIGRPGREVLRWRWVTLALPAGLLTAALDGSTRPSPHVRVLRRHEAPRARMAHLHLHVGAVYPFELLWTRMATCLDDPAVHAPGPYEGFGDHLLCALVARRWLAHRLRIGKPWAPAPSLGPRTTRRAVAEGLGRLAAGAPTLDPRLRVMLRRAAVWSGRRPGIPSSQAHVWADDPIGDGGPWPEGLLLHRGVRLPPAGREAALFWQYVRVKVAFYRHVVSDPARPGLPSFVQTFARVRPYESDLGRVGLDLAREPPDVDLGAVEVRARPPARASWLLHLVAPRRPHPARPEPPPVGADLEWGWTFHFLRATGPLTGPGPLHPGERLRRRYRGIHLRCRTLEDALGRWPQLLAVVRALDVAGDETQGPLWLAIPALRRLRAYSERVAAARPGWRLRPLQLTLHVGEDYRSLLAGLRAVHEPVAWGLLRPGDRLGHALALGAHPGRWYDTHPTVHQPRWERLQDLLWAGGTARAHGLAAPDERSVRRLAWEIWGQPVPLDELEALRRQLGGPDLLVRAGALRNGRPSGGPAALLWRVLHDRRTAARAWAPVAVDTGPDRELASALHAAVRRSVAAAGLAVELNPTSNLVVGALGAPLDQPAFQIRPVDRDAAEAIPVTLNADDPTSFSTCLSHEVAYARAGLIVAAGVAPEYVGAWLEEAARNSWRFRFTTPASADLARHYPIPQVVSGSRRWARP